MPKPPYVRTFVAAPEFQRLRELASASGVQLNDLLLREMVLAILDWQAEQGRGSLVRARGRATRGGAIRITMPVNLRSEGHRRLPAANVLSYGFVHARPGAWSDPRSLLGSIAGETRAIVDQGWPQVFLTGLGIAQQAPGLLGLILSLSRSFSTLVFSNLGDVVRRMRFRPPLVDGKLTAGNVTLERITLVPPVRPGTRLAMAAAIYNGTLSLSAQGCPRTLGLAGAEIFQTLFVQRLARLAELPQPQQSANPVALQPSGLSAPS